MNERLTRRQLLKDASLLASTGVLMNACNQSTLTHATTEPTVVTAYSWLGPDNVQQNVVAFNALFDGFHQAHPDISIKWTLLSAEDYDMMLRVRVAAGTAADLLMLHPGTEMYRYINAGTLTDLSKETWTKYVEPGAQRVASYHQKIYGLPVGQSALGVIYNQKIFQELHLVVPSNWSEFLQTCRMLKAKGFTPLALGMNGAETAEYIPYAMAPSALYQHDLDFDERMRHEQATFSSSVWKDMLQDYLALYHQGFFTADPLHTTSDQAIQYIAEEKAAMIIEGNWSILSIQQANPGIQLGMFPLPYVTGDTLPWVSSAVSAVLGISAQTKVPEQAKTFLRYWSQPEVMKSFVETTLTYSSFSNVDVVMTSPVGDMIPYLKFGSYPFLNQQWPDGVQATMLRDIQELFSGTISIDQMLSDMDMVFQQHRTQVE
ncbi:ABC transporter substrate-binding protein [Tengunoibacter tsumagoiensis]|uniref:ABC transporter substrate-binding protein n=1 Tax=Tengunoibacter tsumagoiensis TaxID=2014871 RepID=A0A402A7T5_9CHLR|nr:extracellular solute-binding protein [Tengunoibacter tsumagoiensis]GCE15138.1 ABC transporter substrate-binding protein [Tengunoibacter tsumagoiensis]